MGNTCAQDCAASSTPEGGEVSIDLNAERTHVYAVPAVRHDAKTSSLEHLPRLGLGSPGPPYVPKTSPTFGERHEEEAVNHIDRRDYSQEYHAPGKSQKTIVEHLRTSCGSAQTPVCESVQDSVPAFATATSLEIVFDVHGLEKRVQLQRRPLGAEFAKQGSGPCKIEKIRPHSHASELSMEVGWSVKSIGGIDVTKRTFEDMQNVLKNSMMALPMHSPVLSSGVMQPVQSSGLELVFDVGGCEKRVQLNRRPLGAEFNKRSKGPTRIDKIRPQSYAAELGMEIGWSLKCIDGEDVTKKSFAQTQAALQNVMMALPLAQQ